MKIQMKFIRNIKNIQKYDMGVVPGGAAQGVLCRAMAVYPIPTKGGGGRLCPTNNIGTPGFSDLPKALRLFTIR